MLSRDKRTVQFGQCLGPLLPILLSHRENFLEDIRRAKPNRRGIQQVAPKNRQAGKTVFNGGR